MSRFFAFGCSFTNYLFPTWADLISDQFDHYENWGNSGTGNHFHFNSLIECHQRHNINSNDTVVVCWSNTGREDRYINQWEGAGNIYTQNLYDEQWVKRFITERGCIIRDFAFMRSAQLLLESLQCKFEFFSTVPLFYHDEMSEYHKDSIKNLDVYELYENLLKIVKPSYLESIFDGKWQYQLPTGEKRDIHPSPEEHIAYIEQHTDFKISDEMRELASKETVRFIQEPVFRMQALGKTSPWQPKKIKRL